MTYEGILSIAEELYEAVPDREFVRSTIRTRMWKPDEDHIDRALRVIESKVQSSKAGKVITFNGRKGRWITDDFDRLRFVRQDKSNDEEAESVTYDPMTLDKEKIWQHIKEELGLDDSIDEAYKRYFIQRELDIRKHKALFSHYKNKCIQSNEVAVEALEKSLTQYLKISDLFKHDIPIKLDVHTKIDPIPIPKAQNTEVLQKVTQQILDIREQSKPTNKKRSELYDQIDETISAK